MKTGWIALIVLIIVTINASSAKTNGVDGVNGTLQDEIDDFVPYQGERSNIFDWNLLQVNFY